MRDNGLRNRSEGNRIAQMLECFEQDEKGDQRRFAIGGLLGEETLIEGWCVEFAQLPICGHGLKLPIGRLVNSRHSPSFLLLTMFPLAGFAFGRFAIVSNVAL